MGAGYPLVADMEEVLPLEGLMDHQLVEDPMVVEPQGAPMVHYLQIPTVPDLTDRDHLLQVSRGLGLQVP